VDWTRSSADVYNFVRALTRPYPGAFSYLGDDRIAIWHCALLPAGMRGDARPGEVLGPVVSPRAGACGQLVACGDGAVVVLEIQQGAAPVMRGRALSDLQWTGQLLGRPVDVPVSKTA
jgi:methionyl-tRNA formyltransferase